MSEKVHLSIRAPKELMKELKIVAIEKETTVTQIVLELLEDYLEQNKK